MNRINPFNKLNNLISNVYGLQLLPYVYILQITTFMSLPAPKF